ncbi:MAG: helix-turn-helix transcriptional regulator [Myxococcota bacterium]
MTSWSRRVTRASLSGTWIQARLRLSTRARPRRPTQRCRRIARSGHAVRPSSIGAARELPGRERSETSSARWAGRRLATRPDACYTDVMADDALATILDAATAAASLSAFRETALTVLAASVPHDVAVFHAFSPRVPLATACVRGVALEVVAATLPRWDALAVELGRLRDHALTHGGVVSDDEVFARGPGRRAFEEAVARPLGVSSIAFVHLVVRARIGAGVLLGRRRGAFDAAERDALRRLAPALAAGDALHAALDAAPRASLPVALRCEDQRLTARQRQIVELVAHGHTTPAIAAALGVSSNTLRNHLARIFERLGAANRADVVRLAVLVPARAD